MNLKRILLLFNVGCFGIGIQLSCNTSSGTLRSDRDFQSDEFGISLAIHDGWNVISESTIPKTIEFVDSINNYDHSHSERNYQQRVMSEVQLMISPGSDLTASPLIIIWVKKVGFQTKATTANEFILESIASMRKLMLSDHNTTFNSSSVQSGTLDGTAFEFYTGTTTRGNYISHQRLYVILRKGHFLCITAQYANDSELKMVMSQLNELEIK